MLLIVVLVFILHPLAVELPGWVPERWLTAQDLSELFQVPRRAIYHYVDVGLLPARHLGPRLLRFTRGDVQVFLERSGSENR